MKHIICSVLSLLLFSSMLSQTFVKEVQQRFLRSSLLIDNSQIAVAAVSIDSVYQNAMPSLMLFDTTGNLLQEWHDTANYTINNIAGFDFRLDRFANGDILIAGSNFDKWYLQRFNLATQQRSTIYTDIDSVGLNSGIVDIKILDNQDILVSGYNYPSGSSTGYRYFVERISPQGSVIWTHPIGSTGFHNTLSSLIATTDSLLFVGTSVTNHPSITGASFLLEKLDLNGQVLMDTVFDYSNLFFIPTDLRVQGDTSVLLLARSKQTTSSSTSHLRFMSFDFDGNILWNHFYPVGNLRMAPRVLSDYDSDGNLTILSNEHPILNKQDIHLFKVSPDGNLLWYQNVDFGWDDGANQSIVLLPNDKFILIGSTDFFGSVMNINHAFITKLNKDGTINQTSLNGEVFEDTNGNGTLDIGEQKLPGVNISATPGHNYGSTDFQGKYAIPILNSGSYTLQAHLPQYWEYTSPTSGNYSFNVNISPSNSLISNLDFGIRPIPGIHDLRLTTINGPFRPGFAAYIQLIAVNEGTTNLQNPTLKFVVNNLANLTSIEDSSFTVNQDTLIWTPPNIAVGSYWRCKLDFLVPPNVNLLGDSVCYTFKGEIAGNDTTPQNNLIQRCATITGAYDPNDKLVSPSGQDSLGIIPPSTPYLDYTIRFQNTGTDTAFNVVIIDTLDTNVLDPSTIRNQFASHAYTFTLDNDGIMRWTFFNIQLPDSGINEPLSHGFIQFRIDLQASLPIYTHIRNRASIYFDFNPPIVTNYTQNLIYECPPVLNNSLTICQGDSVWLGGAFQYQAGVYADTFINSFQCDSIISTQLSIASSSFQSSSISLCQGDSIWLAGAFRSQSGTYVDTLLSSFQCDSIISTQLAILPTSSQNISLSICQGDSIWLGGAFRYQAGTYIDTLINSLQCDSIVSTLLSILPASSQNTSLSICQGDSVWLGGAFRFQAGTYGDTLLNSVQCDSIILTQLSILPTSFQNAALNICQGDSIWLAGAFQTQSGTYVDTFVNSFLCDSIISTQLIVSPTAVQNALLSICQGDSVWLAGAFQYQAGVYIDTFSTSLQCDSIVSTQLSIAPTAVQNAALSICQGDSIWLGGAFQKQAGTYTDSLSTQAGCDSVVQTQLTVLSVDNSLRTENDTIIAIAGYDHYQWYDCETSMPIQGAESYFYTPPTSGLYQVKITNGPCSYFSDCQSLNLVNLENLSLGNLVTISPNPTNGIFTIELQSASQGLRYQLIDLQGRVLFDQSFSDQLKQSLDLSSYPQGLYLLNCSYQNQSVSFKIIKN